MNFGELIKKSRKERRLSLKLAAQYMGICQSHLHYIECGKVTKPKMETLYRIISFYGLPVDGTCEMVKRIPMDVYYKIVNNPDLIPIIRNLKA